MNKEKVNMMREMTLLNDKNIKLEREMQRYIKVSHEAKLELDNYQK
jgi:hypothetical protein